MKCFPGRRRLLPGRNVQGDMQNMFRLVDPWPPSALQGPPLYQILPKWRRRFWQRRMQMAWQNLTCPWIASGHTWCAFWVLLESGVLDQHDASHVPHLCILGKTVLGFFSGWGCVGQSYNHEDIPLWATSVVADMPAGSVLWEENSGLLQLHVAGMGVGQCSGTCSASWGVIGECSIWPLPHLEG